MCWVSVLGLLLHALWELPITKKKTAAENELFGGLADLGMTPADDVRRPSLAELYHDLELADVQRVLEGVYDFKDPCLHSFLQKVLPELAHDLEQIQRSMPAY